MHVQVTPSEHRVITIRTTLPDLLALYEAVTSTGRRTAADKRILGELAAGLRTDPDVAAAVGSGEDA